MNSGYVIGLDIGGTNTDGVLIDHNDNILASTKITTTEDISIAFQKVIEDLLDTTSITPDDISSLFLGTTHAANAILQNRNLHKVGVIRISGHYPHSIPSGYGWPKELKKSVIVGYETIGGGFECNGTSLSKYSEEEATKAILKLLKQGAESFAIVGTFSPLNDTQEKDLEIVIQEVAGLDTPVSLSAKVGGVGFIERENSTILNAALKKVMQQGFQKLQKVCDTLHLTCPLMITQNDGSLTSIEYASDYPVLTISAGPTNSFIGGARLTGFENAVIVDIGGTSTDVGLVRNRFPVRSIGRSSIGNIPLNFPMPDVLSIGLGGGSFVNVSDKKTTIGPQSVGKDLFKKSQSFGGDTLTLTDIAIAAGELKLPGMRYEESSVSPNDTQRVYNQTVEMIESLVMKMQGELKTVPVVLVGGGAALIPQNKLSDRFVIPKHYDVANAYGSALSEVCGTVDTIVSMENREAVLCQMQQMAEAITIEKGADPNTIRLIDIQIFPYHYVENKMARVVVKCSGKWGEMVH